jgi:hypothetical protein
MSMPYKGNCEHLKEGYCIACISKIRDNWGAIAMSFSKDSKCYINVWDGDYPKMIEITNDPAKNSES